MNVLKVNKDENTGLLMMRITIGVLILFHGVANMTSNYGFIKGVLDGIGIPTFVAYGAFIGEIVAPVLIIIGWRTRLASFILAFSMLSATLMVHSGDIFSLNQFGGWGIELQGLYLFGSIIIFLTGPGKYAISTSSVWD